MLSTTFSFHFTSLRWICSLNALSLGPMLVPVQRKLHESATKDIVIRNSAVSEEDLMNHELVGWLLSSEPKILGRDMFVGCW
jgi:hypothetical protein